MMSIQAGHGGPPGAQGGTPRYCSTCGALLSAGAALCGECGARYRESPYEKRATDAPGAWAAPPRRRAEAAADSAPAEDSDQIQLLGSSAPEPPDPAGTALRGRSQYDRGMDAQQPAGVWGQPPSPAQDRPADPGGPAPLEPPLDGCAPAGTGKRVLAFIIDGVIAGITALPLWIGTILLVLQSHPTLATILTGLGAALPIAYALVIVWLQGSRGFTLGGLIMGLRVVREDTGAPLGFGRSLARYVVLALLTWIAGLTTFLDPERHGRGLHDRMISTILVDARAGRDPYAPRPDDFARPDAAQYLGDPSVPVSVRENLTAKPGAAWEEPAANGSPAGGTSQGGAASPAAASAAPAPPAWGSPVPAPSPAQAQPSPAWGSPPDGAREQSWDAPAASPGASQGPVTPSSDRVEEPIITSSPWAPPPPAPHEESSAPAPAAADDSPPADPRPADSHSAQADEIVDPWAPPSEGSAAAASEPAEPVQPIEPVQPEQFAVPVDPAQPAGPDEPARPAESAQPVSGDDPSAAWTSSPAPAAEPVQSAPTPAPAQAPAPSSTPAPVGAPADLDESTRLTQPTEDLGDVEATRVVPARRDRRPGYRLLLDDGSVHEVRGVATLGRNPAAETGEERLVLADETRSVSKSHLRLEATVEGLQVTDLGSTNGSALILADGSSQDLDPHSPLSLPDGATLSIGDRTLTVERIQ